MACPRCGSEVNERWKFCPKCGTSLGRRRGIFGDIFKRMEQEMRGIDRAMERNFEVLDISPFFRKPARGGGFSVKITRRGDEKPKFSVKTFGDVERKELESEMGKLGLKEVPKPEPEKKPLEAS